MATTTMTADTFEETVSDGIVLIDFWASWCGPCRMFAPVYERVSEENADITFAKVDTEDQPELAQAFEITSIPTLVAFRDGIPLMAQPGALPEPILRDLVQKIRDLDMVDIRKQYDDHVHRSA